MTLDATGSRANDPGWTPAAKKAEKKAQAKAKKDASRAKAKAWRQAAAKAVAHFITEVWDFILRNLLLTIAIGTAMVATPAWEWWNSARGWQDLYPGAGWWAYVGAGGAVGLWYVAFRRAREEARKPKEGRSIIEIGGWTIVALFAYVVCVAGVFVATATNSVAAQHAAKESRVELAHLRARRDTLKDGLEIYSLEYWQAMIDQDERTLEQQVNLAKGTFDMPDLDVAGACAQKLSFNQRRLCVRVNGGTDEFSGEQVIGIRAEIARSERGLKKAKADAEELLKLDNEVVHFKLKTGDETADAVGAMFNLFPDPDAKAIPVNSEAAMGLMLLMLSSVFLAASGWVTDWVLETVEKKRIAGRVKAGRTT